MTKKLAALAALVLLLLTQRPHAQAARRPNLLRRRRHGRLDADRLARPARRCWSTAALREAARRSAACSTRSASRRSTTPCITHYHIDHMGGMIEVLNAGKVAGIAFDNGDGAGVQPPGTSTSSNSTRGTYLNYVTATGHAGVTRQTAIPGNVHRSRRRHARDVPRGGRTLPERRQRRRSPTTI